MCYKVCAEFDYNDDEILNRRYNRVKACAYIKKAFVSRSQVMI